MFARVILDSGRGRGHGRRHGKEGNDEEGLHGGFVVTTACSALMFVL